jgi:hypothetical protein
MEMQLNVKGRTGLWALFEQLQNQEDISHCREATDVCY